jgi:hypothetical protein
MIEFCELTLSDKKNWLKHLIVDTDMSDPKRIKVEHDKSVPSNMSTNHIQFARTFAHVEGNWPSHIYLQLGWSTFHPKHPVLLMLAFDSLRHFKWSSSIQVGEYFFGCIASFLYFSPTCTERFERYSFGITSTYLLVEEFRFEASPYQQVYREDATRVFFKLSPEVLFVVATKCVKDFYFTMISLFVAQIPYWYWLPLSHTAQWFKNSSVFMPHYHWTFDRDIEELSKDGRLVTGIIFTTALLRSKNRIYSNKHVHPLTLISIGLRKRRIQYFIWGTLHLLIDWCFPSDDFYLK